MPPYYFTEDDVLKLLTMEDAIAGVELSFRLLAEGKAVNRPRARVRAERLLLHVMPAGSAALGYVGLKAYTTAPSGARFRFLLFDATTGELSAWIEADRLGQIRTGAASGVATRLMARQDATRVGIFGSGWQARSQLEAIVRVRPIESIVVYSPRAESRERFAGEMSESLGVAVRPTAEPESAAGDVDIVVTATSAKEPVLRGEWLRPGQHVNAIGSNHLRRIEIDEAAVLRADLVVTDSLEQARIECGDLAAVIEAGKRSWDDVHELSEVVVGARPGRGSDDEITLFESQGLAIQDVVSAKHVFEQGRAKGYGTALPFGS